MEIGNMFDYGNRMNSYRMPSISVVEVKKENDSLETLDNNQDLVTSSLSVQTVSEETKEQKAVPQLSIQDANISLKGVESFEMVGKNSDIAQLDIQQAISDMKKDSILERYQFFVGNSQNIMQNNIENDGIVISKL